MSLILKIIIRMKQIVIIMINYQMEEIMKINSKETIISIIKAMIYVIMTVIVGVPLAFLAMFLLMMICPAFLMIAHPLLIAVMLLIQGVALTILTMKTIIIVGIVSILMILILDRMEKKQQK